MKQTLPMDADITLKHCSLPLECSHLSVRPVMTGCRQDVICSNCCYFRLNFYNTLPYTSSWNYPISLLHTWLKLLRTNHVIYRIVCTLLLLLLSLLNPSSTIRKSNMLQENTWAYLLTHHSDRPNSFVCMVNDWDSLWVRGQSILERNAWQNNAQLLDSASCKTFWPQGTFQLQNIIHPWMWYRRGSLLRCRYRANLSWADT